MGIKQTSFRVICQRIAVLPVLLSLVSCSYINDQYGTDLPENPFATARTGAAAGAGLGAGVGAVIGATTGNLAPGIIVGSLAGGATGAIVGQHFEDQARAEQAEYLEEQNAVISTQRHEIKELRGGLEEHSQNGLPASRTLTSLSIGTAGPRMMLSSANSPSVAGANFSPDTYRGSPRAKPFAPEGTSVWRAEVQTSPPVLAMTPQPQKFEPLTPHVTSVPLVQREAPVLVPGSGLPPARIISPPESQPVLVERPQNTLVSSLPPPVVSVKPTRAAEPIKPIGARPPIKTETLKTETKIVEQVVSKDLSAECKEAASEVERARVAPSSADKLFYYRRALRLCPENSGYHVEIGKVYVEIGRRDDAQFEFKQAVDLDPTNTQAKSELSFFTG